MSPMWFFFVSAAVSGTADGADILAIFPTPSYSHQIVYRAYALELNRRGHNLTVVTTDPMRDPNLKNYREIDVSFYYEHWNKRFQIASDKAKFLRWVPELFLIAFADTMSEICEMYLSHPEVNRLIVQREQFDLFVVEFGVSSCFYPFARQSRNNFIGIFSMAHTTIVHSNIGNDATASYLPDPLLGELSRLTLTKRFRAFLFQLVGWVVYWYITREHTAIARKYFGEDIPSTVVYERNVSAVLLNNHFTVTFPRPMTPNLIDIGGPALHLLRRTPKPLPKSSSVTATALGQRHSELIGEIMAAVREFLIWFVLFTSVAESAKILAVIPAPSVSHQFVYRRYLAELSRRGHSVTVATPFPVANHNLTNFRQIDCSRIMDYWRSLPNDTSLASDGGWLLRTVPEMLLLFLYNPSVAMCEIYLSHPEMVDIVKRNEKFDLFVIEWGVLPCLLPYMRQANNVTVGISSFAMAPWSHLMAGSTYNPSYIPEFGLPYSHSMTFLQRMRNTILYFNVILYMHFFMKGMHETAKRHFGPDLPKLETFERKPGVILTNYHVSTNYPRPFAANIIPIGGPPFHMIDVDGNPLPQDLQQFLDGAEDGVILFSLGSNVKSDAMPEKKRQIFVESFKQLKQKVIWKWESDVLPGKPDNVKFAKWLPQTDILAHSNVKAFITQGGLQSIGEATYHMVPMIVIPFFADQELNAQKLTTEGVAIRVDYETLELTTFQNALKEILNNPAYKQNMIRYSMLTKDQPQSPMERAIWWTEYVIRHKGARHLRSAAVDMPWYQYFLLDVIAFLFACLLLFIFVLAVLLKCLKNVLFRSRKPKKE